MVKRAFTFVEVVVVVAIIGILAVILFPVFNRAGDNAYRADCQSNEKQIALAFLQYAGDYDARLPPVSSRSSGWADLVYPYTKSWALFNCPSTPVNPLPSTDYFYNGRVAGLNSTRIVAPTNTLLLGEGDDARSTSAELRRFPVAPIKNQKSPAWRHQSGANYVFADGHVKWIKPEDFETWAKWNPRQLTP